MKFRWLLTLPLAACLCALGADYYKLRSVRRLDSNLYKAHDGLYIETRFCFHLTLGEDALLRWEGQHSYNNKILWEDDDSPCEVAKVWK
jgi:hypothetical protein